MLNRDQNDQHFISHKSTNTGTLLQQKCRLQRKLNSQREPRNNIKSSVYMQH